VGATIGVDPAEVAEVPPPLEDPVDPLPVEPPLPVVEAPVVPLPVPDVVAEPSLLPPVVVAPLPLDVDVPPVEGLVDEELVSDVVPSAAPIGMAPVIEAGSARPSGGVPVTGPITAVAGAFGADR
jgi:hypothetical protein